MSAMYGMTAWALPTSARSHFSMGSLVEPACSSNNEVSLFLLGWAYAAGLFASMPLSPPCKEMEARGAGGSERRAGRPGSARSGRQRLAQLTASACMGSGWARAPSCRRLRWCCACWRCRRAQCARGWQQRVHRSGRPWRRGGKRKEAAGLQSRARCAYFFEEAPPYMYMLL